MTVLAWLLLCAAVVQYDYSRLRSGYDIRTATSSHLYCIPAVACTRNGNNDRSGTV